MDAKLRIGCKSYNILGRAGATIVGRRMTMVRLGKRSPEGSTRSQPLPWHTWPTCK